jgi:Leucine-rich repeat (LRR) protein
MMKQVLNLAHNDITSAKVPPSLFSLGELNTLDLSYNSLTEVG